MDYVSEIKVVIQEKGGKVRFAGEENSVGVFVDGKFLPVRNLDLKITPTEEVLVLEIHLFKVTIKTI